MPSDQRSGARRRRAAVTAAALAAVAGAGLSTVPAGASPHRAVTASSLVAAARRAILARDTVHIVSVSRDASTRRVAGRSTIDAGRRASEQHFVAGAAWIRIRLTSGYAYLSGNKDGLTTMFAMPADDEGRVGTKWVAIRRGEPIYTGFATAVITSLPAQILPSTSTLGTVRLSSGHDGGRPVHVLTWRATVGKATVAVSLELAARGPVLPVAETKASGTIEQRSVFGRWNERVAVSRPRQTVPYTSLSST